MSTDGPAIEMSGFGLELGGRVLLRGVDLCLPRGAFALIVGPSGSGKSALLSVLAALPLPPPRGQILSGQARVLGQALPLRGARPAVGIVFQDYALFDEWSVADNLRFAREHASNSKAARPSDERLLESLGLAPDLDLRTASGGQRQRVAIARALAQDPELLLFDEPTSGLDPAAARRVAELVGEVHRRRSRTTVVITHDPAPFRELADTVLLLDPGRRSLRPIAWDDLRTEPSAPPPPAAGRGRSSAAHRAGAALAALGEATADVSLVLLSAPLELFPRWPRARWGWRFLLRALRVAHGGTSLIYIGLAGAIGGFVAAFFGLTHLPLKAFLEPLVLDDVIAALGFALFRVVIPVLATLLIAARAGAAIAADLGAWSYTRRLAAMASFGVPPERYLRAAFALVLLLGAPLLTAWAFLTARVVATMVYAYTQPDPSLIFFERHFTRLLETGGLWVGSGWFLAKTAACGLGTAVLAARIGEAPKHSAQELSRGVTAAILATTLWVLAVHFFASLAEFR